MTDNPYDTGAGDRSETQGKYLTFWTNEQLFGVPIADVVQIVGMQTITAIPEFPDYAKGIINLRGIIIPIIDVRLRLRKAEAEYNERTCIIVSTINDRNIGFIVDAVDAVTKIEDENISQPPVISADTVNTYLTGVATLENRVVLLLNTSKMVSEDDVSAMTGEFEPDQLLNEG